MSSYWEMREILFNQRYVAVEKKLQKAYDQLMRDTEQEVRKLYDDIEAQGEHVLLSTIYRFDKYYDLLNYLSQELNTISNLKLDLMRMNLSMLYKEHFEMMSKYDNFKVSVDEQNLQKAIKSIWCANGRHWSSAI